MDRSTLRDRLKGILDASLPSGTVASPPDRVITHDSIEQILGGAWCGTERACLVVERRLDPAVVYGQLSVGEMGERIQRSAAEASIAAGGTIMPPPFLFFDLETTGLSGGAGTYPFLVGYGWFDGEGSFLTRQYLLVRAEQEPFLLSRVTVELERAGALVSFNGRSFDGPLLETRYLYHRLEWIGARLPHLDLLHPARAFWRRRGSEMADDHRSWPRPSADVPARQVVPREVEGCSLVSLERRVLGVRRAGDVPGAEIPARYFQFVQSGESLPLVPVLEHNRLDLLSLAGLTARALHLLRSGPDHVKDSREALALGRLYMRAGFEARGREAFERAAAVTSAGEVTERIEGLRALALAWRRARNFQEAAGCWRRLLDESACPPPIAREAAEALAIHHEHRLQDLGAARAFALRTLEHERRGAWTHAVGHRLARIERKMRAADRGALLE